VKTDDGVSAIVYTPQGLAHLHLGHSISCLGKFDFGLLKGLLVILILCQIEKEARLIKTGSMLLPLFYNSPE
jgi:hypothetical protein